MFKTQQELKDHQQERNACLKGSSDLPEEIESIDDVQWEKIEVVLGSKKGQKPINDTRKWFAVWRILFPDEPEPSNPCR